MWWDSRHRLSVSLFLCVLYLPRFSVWQLFLLTVEGPLGTLVKGVLLSVKLAFSVVFESLLACVLSAGPLSYCLEDTLLH